MIPAVEAQLEGSDIGDIGSAPAVPVELVNGKIVVRCIGLIDTGADLSAVDSSLAQELGLQDSSVRRQLYVHLPGSAQSQNVYYLDLLITGHSNKERVQFTNIPVVVAPLGRRLLMIGRRGVLERLKVELDFPRGEIVLTRSLKRHKKYPNLAEEIVSIDSIIATIESQPTAAILQLSWEIEQFIDRLIAESEDLHHAQTSSLTRNRTLADKLRLIETQGTVPGISEAARSLVEARNQAAHGMRFVRPDRLSLENLLTAANDVVGRLRRLQKSKPPVSG
jgi:predicted aspartyl protease